MNWSFKTKCRITPNLYSKHYYQYMIGCNRHICELRDLQFWWFFIYYTKYYQVFVSILVLKIYFFQSLIVWIELFYFCPQWKSIWSTWMDIIWLNSYHCMTISDFSTVKYYFYVHWDAISVQDLSILNLQHFLAWKHFPVLLSHSAHTICQCSECDSLLLLMNILFMATTILAVEEYMNNKCILGTQAMVINHM